MPGLGGRRSSGPGRSAWPFLVALMATVVLVAAACTSPRAPAPVRSATAASTGPAKALFSPLRRRVQQIVDRRFNRVRYDAGQTAAAFAARLRDAVDLDTVRADLLAAVTSAVEPAHVSVWIAAGTTARDGVNR